MNHFSLKFRTTILITGMIILSVFVLSCENKIDIIPKSDLLTLPSLTDKDFESVFTDSGKLQLILSSPLLEKYDNKTDPYSEFIYGIKVVFYDGQKHPKASVTSKYAKYTENNKTWELKDSVVVVNEENDKLETEILYWDQQKDLIYTDRFVKITNADEIVMGTGFESDSRLVRRRIKKSVPQYTLKMRNSSLLILEIIWIVTGVLSIAAGIRFAITDGGAKIFIFALMALISFVFAC